jgi:hypothetical protein
MALSWDLRLRVSHASRHENFGESKSRKSEKQGERHGKVGELLEVLVVGFGLSNCLFFHQTLLPVSCA